MYMVVKCNCISSKW